MRPLIEVRGLRKDYRRGGDVLHAVDGIDLAVMPSESVGVIGESGSGGWRPSGQARGFRRMGQITDQLGGERMSGRSDHRPGCACLDDRALSHHGDRFAALGYDAQVMGDEQDSHAGTRPQTI